MSKRGVILLAVLGGVVLAMGALLFDWRQREVPTPASAEARRNPLLAFERLLEELELEVTVRSRLGEPPAPSATVVYVLRAVPTSAEEVEALSAWVERGGRLWIVVDPDWHAEGLEDFVDPWSPDPLLEGLELGWSEPDRERTAYAATLDDESYEVELHGPLVTDVGSDWEVDDQGFVADVLHGEGSVVLCAASAWLSNDELGDEEHARLAWDLVRREGTPSEVVLVRDRDAFDFLAWLAGPGFSLGAVLLLAIAFLIARRGMRLGPIAEELPSGRRDFAEHLRAAGTFLWKRGDRDELVARLRAAVRASAPADPEERRAWVLVEAERTGLSPDRLREAWTTDTTPDAARFVRIVRTLADQARAQPHVKNARR